MDSLRSLAYSEYQGLPKTTHNHSFNTHKHRHSVFLMLKRLIIYFNHLNWIMMFTSHVINTIVIWGLLLPRSQSPHDEIDIEGLRPPILRSYSPHDQSYIGGLFKPAAVTSLLARSQTLRCMSTFKSSGETLRRIIPFVLLENCSIFK